MKFPINIKLNSSNFKLKKSYLIILFILVLMGAVATANYIFFPSGEVTYRSGQDSLTLDPVSDQYKIDHHVDYDGKFTISQPENKNGATLLSGVYYNIYKSGKLVGYNLAYYNGIGTQTVTISGNAIVTPKGNKWIKDN